MPCESMCMNVTSYCAKCENIDPFFSGYSGRPFPDKPELTQCPLCGGGTEEVPEGAPEPGHSRGDVPTLHPGSE